jgi:diamine N-acetyltransferase
MNDFLGNKRLLLRSLCKNDLSQIIDNFSNREIQLLTGEVYPSTEMEIEEFYKKCQKTDDRIWLIIVDKESNKIIGETGYLRIFSPWRTADYSLIIWDKNYWHKGYGTEVAELMLEYGFNYLNLHRIAIGVLENNQNAIKFWKSIGFKEEGRQIDGYFGEGKYSDFIMMCILENDYREKNSKRK